MPGKVAIIHDWLTGMRGGEVVLEAILELYPNADLYTLLYKKGSLSPLIEDRKIYTSFIDRLPLKNQIYRHYLPLFPTAIELFDFRSYDLIVSSSHCVAKGVIAPPGVPHISFIHSPMRYVWDMYSDYFGKKGLSAKIIPFFANYLRMWDSSSAHRVDQFISNSHFVKERIRKFYGREATVIPPPCLKTGQVTFNKKEDFYLVVSALVPYKRIDLAIQAFAENRKPLKIVGDGPELGKLKQSTSGNIEFLGKVSRNEIFELYSKAKGLVFPGVEDFGIVPVEAQSMGCPVLAFGKGGALETVVSNKTGVFFTDQTVESLNQAINRSENISYKKKDFEKSVIRFTSDKFKSSFKKAADNLLKGYRF